MRSLTKLAVLLATASIAMASAAPAVVPGQVDFQGLLLDDLGQPVNGAVTLDFTLFDAPTGGSSVWTETLTGVQVVDGVYSVTLGAQTPITPAVLTTGSLHLEIVVDGETLSPRRPLLAVPYAIRADTADSLGDVQSGFLAQIVEHFSFDGGDPPNEDPSEGLADVDSDGLANFVDRDNDGDGLFDPDELAQGSDINLVTPDIAQVMPSVLTNPDPLTLSVTGTSFLAGFTVTYDGVPVSPSNVTSTSFDVMVTPQLTGTLALIVDLPNGESDSFVLTNDIVRRAFLTDTATNGNLGGISGADALCAAQAAQLAITGTYLAWLGDSTTDPASRFSQDTRRIERLDGVKLADTWADLTDGTLDNAGGFGFGLVWTNVAIDGTSNGSDHCQDWTSSSSGDMGRRGNASSGNSDWTDLSLPVQACDQTAQLYCFED